MVYFQFLSAYSMVDAVKNLARKMVRVLCELMTTFDTVPEER